MHTLMTIGDAEEPQKAVLPFAGPASAREPLAAPTEVKGTPSTEALPFRPQVGAPLGGSALGHSMSLAPPSTQGELAPVAPSLRSLDFDAEPDTERPPAPAATAPTTEAGRTPPPPPLAVEPRWPAPPPPAPFFAPEGAPPAPFFAPEGAPPAPFFAPVDSPSATLPPPAPFFAPVDSPSATLPPPAPFFAPVDSPSATLPPPAPFFAPVHASTSEAPAPPALGAIVHGAPPEVAAEPELAPPVYEEYAAERCGAIAGRIAHAPDATGETLRAEGLDEASWKAVHERRLEEIRAKAARRDRAALADYDRAYVGAIEEARGPIALEQYARFAEAAERSAHVDELARSALPVAAWPHIHRVWIERTVKDFALAGLVRRAIAAERARAGSDPKAV